jgi:general secretion pathway protein A
MYLDFYGLRAEPFHITPDPDFLYLSPSHKEALAAIVYGVEQRKGFITITGEVGVGKTTIVRTYLERYDPEKIKTVLVFNANVSFKGLLKTIYRELGLDPPDVDTYELVHHLHLELIQQYQEGWNVVLIIDEAQNMPVETLENLRMLSNLESTKDKLIQIILIGQPELEGILNLHQLRQLKQRIAIRTKLKPLTREESLDYIRHRLALVQVEKRTLFTDKALKRIVKEAAGIPRRINIICDNALITGFGYGRKTITPAIIGEVVDDLEGRVRKRRPWTWATAVLACAVLAGVFYLWNPTAQQKILLWARTWLPALFSTVEDNEAHTAPAAPTTSRDDLPSDADTPRQRILKPLPLPETGAAPADPGRKEALPAEDEPPPSTQKTEPLFRSPASLNRSAYPSPLLFPADFRGVPPSPSPVEKARLARLLSVAKPEGLTLEPVVLSGTGGSPISNRGHPVEGDPKPAWVAKTPREPPQTAPEKKKRLPDAVPAPPGATKDSPPPKAGSTADIPSVMARQAPAGPQSPESASLDVDLRPSPSTTAGNAPAGSPPSPPTFAQPSDQEVPQPDPGKVIDFLLNKRSKTRPSPSTP